MSRDDVLQHDLDAITRLLATAIRQRDEARKQLSERTTQREYWVERAEAAEQQVATLREAAQRVADAYTAEAEDWNDGEFALWKKDDLVMAIVNLRTTLAATEEQAE